MPFIHQKWQVLPLFIVFNDCKMKILLIVLLTKMRKQKLKVLSGFCETVTDIFLIQFSDIL